jgi:hypothetical protein
LDHQIDTFPHHQNHQQYYHLKNNIYNLAIVCKTWCLPLKDVQEQSTENKIWTYPEWSNRAMEEIVWWEV